MLCKSALRAMNSFGQYNSSSLAQRGLFINYESLPGIIPQAILPLFEVIPTNTWLTRMKQEVNHYSKARGMKNYIFQGDSEDKDARATLRIKQYSEEILDKSYSQLEHNAVISLSRVLPALEKLANSDRIDWKILSSIPGDMYPFMLNVSENNEAYRIFRSTKKFAYKISEDPKHIPHSTFIERDYTSWAPFANHHNSRRYQVMYYLCVD